jgi:hypothetical protein
MLMKFARAFSLAAILMMLIVCATTSLNAQALAACNSQCHLNYDWIINDLSNARGLCYNQAGYDFYNCNYVAYDDYENCMSWASNAWEESTCQNNLDAEDAYCTSQLQSEKGSCDTTYNMNLQEYQQDLDDCLFQCSSSYWSSLYPLNLKLLAANFGSRFSKSPPGYGPASVPIKMFAASVGCKITSPSRRFDLN